MAMDVVAESLLLVQKYILLCTAWGPLGKGWVELICFSAFFSIPCDRYGHFSGINRKVQLTYLPHGHPKAASEDEGKET